MTNIIFRLIVYSLIFNIASGIILTAVPAFISATNINSTSGEGGITYTINKSSGFLELTDAVNPSGNLEDKSSAIDRLLDTIGIGYIKKFLNVIDTYLYGFATVLNNMFGGYLPSGVN